MKAIILVTILCALLTHGCSGERASGNIVAFDALAASSKSSLNEDLKKRRICEQFKECERIFADKTDTCVRNYQKSAETNFYPVDYWTPTYKKCARHYKQDLLKCYYVEDESAIIQKIEECEEIGILVKG